MRSQKICEDQFGFVFILNSTQCAVAIQIVYAHAYKEKGIYSTIFTIPRWL